MQNKLFFSGLNELRAFAAFAVVFHHIELYKQRLGLCSLYDVNIINTFIENLGKNTRYYISNKGGYLFKSKMDNSNYLAGVNVGFLTTTFNQYANKPIKDYNLNYAFYIRECRKIVDIIEDKQLKLF